MNNKFINENFKSKEEIKILNEQFNKEENIIDKIKSNYTYFILGLLDLKYVELLNLNIFLKENKLFNYKDKDGGKLSELELLKYYLLEYKGMKYCYSSPELFKLVKIFMIQDFNFIKEKNKFKKKKNLVFDKIFSNNNFSTDPINIEFKTFLIYPILNMFNKKIIKNAKFYDYSLNDNIEVYSKIFLDITEKISLYSFISHCISMLNHIQKFKSISYIYYIQSYICSIKKLLVRNILFNKFNFDNNVEKLKFINNLLNKLKNFADIIYPMIFNILIINKKEIKNLKDNTFGIILRNNQVSNSSDKKDNDYSQIYTWNIKTIKYDILKIMIILFHNFKFFYNELIKENINKKEKLKIEDIKEIFTETYSSLLTKNLLQETVFVNSKIINLLNSINLLIFEDDFNENKNNIIIEKNDKALLEACYNNESSFFNLLTNFNNTLYKIIKDNRKISTNYEGKQKIYSYYYYYCLNLKKDNLLKCIEFYYLEILKYEKKNNIPKFEKLYTLNAGKIIKEDTSNGDDTKDNYFEKKKEILPGNIKYKNYKIYLSKIFFNHVNNISKIDLFNYEFEISNWEIKSILKYVYYICYNNPKKLSFNIEASIILYILIDILKITKNNSFCFDILYSYEIKSIIEYYPDISLILFKTIIELITEKSSNDDDKLSIKTSLLMNNIEIIFDLLGLIFNKKFFQFKNFELHIANNYDTTQSEIWEDYVDDIFKGYDEKKFKKKICNNINKNKDFFFLDLFIKTIKKLKKRVQDFHFNYLEKINYFIFSLLFKKEIILILNNLIILFSNAELNLYYDYIKHKQKVKKQNKVSIKNSVLDEFSGKIDKKMEKIFKILYTLLKLQKDFFNSFNVFEAFTTINLTKEKILEDNSNEFELKLNLYKTELLDNYINGLEILKVKNNLNISIYYFEFILKLNIDLYNKRNELRFNSNELINHNNYFDLLENTIKYFKKNDYIIVKELINKINSDFWESERTENKFEDILEKFKNYIGDKFDLNNNEFDEEKDDEDEDEGEEEENLEEEEENDKNEDNDDEENDEDENVSKKNKINNLIMNFFEHILLLNKPKELHLSVIDIFQEIIKLDGFTLKELDNDSKNSNIIIFNKEEFKTQLNDIKNNINKKNENKIKINYNDEIIKKFKKIFISQRNFLKTKSYYTEKENYDNKDYNLEKFRNYIEELLNKNKKYQNSNLSFNDSLFFKFIKYSSEKECLNKTMENIIYLFISITLDCDNFYLFTDLDFFKLLIIVNELMEKYDNINNNILNIFNKKSSKTKIYFFEILANFIIFELKIISKYHYSDKSDYIKQHIFRIKTWFKFFQNLCEGNMKQFKEFVREKLILDFFYNLFDYFIFFEKILEDERSMNIEIIYGLIDVISEYISGPNKKNQLKLPNNILKEIINVLENFNYEIIDNITEDTKAIKIKISKLLLSYIESNERTAWKLKKLLNINNLYINIYKNILKWTYEYKNRNFISRVNPFYFNNLNLINLYCYSNDFKKKIEFLINLMLLIRYLGNFTKDYKNIEKELRNFNYKKWKIKDDNINDNNSDIISNQSQVKDSRDYVIIDKVAFLGSIKKYCDYLKIDFKSYYINLIYKFFHRIIVKIEVKDENGELLLIYFPKEPMTFYLTDKTKKEFVEKADLSSLKIKQIQIMKDYDIYYMLMKDESVKNKYKYYFTSTDSFYYYELFMFIIYIIINIIYIIDFRYNGTISLLVNFSVLIEILNLIIIAFNFIFILLWFISKIKIYYKIKEFKYKKYKENDGKDKFYKLKIFFKSFTLQKRLIPFIIHFIFGLLYYWNTFFLTLHLFMIIFFSKTMKYIIYGSIKNIDQFLLSLFLAIAIMNTYSILTFNYFTNQIQNENNLCTNLIHCLFSILSFGLKGRSWSETLNFQDNNSNFYAARFFFDLIFYILIPVILFTIFTAILIDTFSQLKQESQQIIEEWSKICFLCGLDTTELLKHKISFYEHVNEVHNIWRYIYYLVHLQLKGKKEFSSVEYWVSECLQESNTEWIPNEITLKILKNNNNNKWSKADYLSDIENIISKKLNLIKNDDYIKSKEETINYILLKKEKFKDENLNNLINKMKENKNKRILEIEEEEEEENDIEIEEETERSIFDTNEIITDNLTSKNMGSNTNQNNNTVKSKINVNTKSVSDNFKLTLDFKKLEEININLNLKPKYKIRI